MDSKPVRITRSQAAQRLRELDNVLILTHRRPDGDTVGSAAALCAALRSLGKRAYVYAHNEYISRLIPFLEGMLQPEEFVPGSYVAVDIASPRLFPFDEKEIAGEIDLSIDHHLGSGGFAKELCVDTSCAACGELLYDILLELGCVTAETALPLYVAVATDTGCFRYSNTTARTHRIAAALMEQGIDVAAVNYRMFECKTRGRLQIESMLVAGASYYDGGTVAITVLSDEMAARAGATADDEDDLAGVMRSVQGVRAAVTIREQKDGTSKISLRTLEEPEGISAEQVCVMFGGGGHMRAAGCTIDRAPSEAALMILEAIRQVRDNA